MLHSKKVLSVFSLVMINVIAVDSLRTLPMSAKLGLPLVSYYLVAAIAFFMSPPFCFTNAISTCCKVEAYAINGDPKTPSLI